MKIPENTNIMSSSLVDDWFLAASQEGLRTGIFVDLKITMRNDRVAEIQFDVMGHLFDNLTDLRKALDNKSFL